MFVFGHLGIGSKLVSPWAKGLPKKLILAGTLAPDVLDKTLYYGLSLATGKHGMDIGLICGTRTFGHTALMLINLTVFSVLSRSKALAAFSLGIASHLLLDSIGDRFSPGFTGEGLKALIWPILGTGFPVMPYAGAEDHLLSFLRPFIVVTETLGLGILSWDYWKRRHHFER